MSALVAFKVGDVPFPLRGEEVIENFFLGAASDARESRELGMVEAAKPFGDIARPRFGGILELIVKLEITLDGWPFSITIDEFLKLYSELPRN